MNKYHTTFSDKEIEEYIEVEFNRKNPPRGIQFIVEPSEYTQNITALILETAKKSKDFKQCQTLYFIYSFHLKDSSANLYGFFWL